MVAEKNITISNAWICQIRQNSIEPIFGDLIISNGKIHEIQPHDFRTFLKQYPDVDDGPYNADGRIITVPLVNFHEHFYSRLARGLPVKGPMDNFIHILENLWWKLDRILDLEMVYACAQTGVLESIRQGVTYIFDHHASPAATKGSLLAIRKVLEQYGLRGVLCFEISDRNGAELAQKGWDEFTYFSEHYTNSEIKSMLGLHASFTLENDTLKKASEVLQNYDTGIHIHLCEDEVDRSLSFKAFRDLPVHRLAENKLLNSKSILAHGIDLFEFEYKIISKSNSAIAYNPDSNLNNAVGLPEYNKVLKSIPLLVGTDGMHANIARSLKQLFLLYRHQGNKIEESFRWLPKIYFDQLKFAKQYFPDFPHLLVGDRADLIIWDYIPPTPISTESFWGHFIYGILEYPIHSVIQNGHFLMKNKIIPGEAGVRKRVYSQGEKLVKDFQSA